MLRSALGTAVVLGLIGLTFGCDSGSGSNAGRRGPAAAGQIPAIGDPNYPVSTTANPVNPQQPSGNVIYPTPQPTSNQQCYKADDFTCQAELAVTEFVNQHRQQKGLQPLQYDPRLSFVAREWSQEQSTRMFGISHAGFPNARESTYQKEFGNVDVSMMAENVAQSYGGSDARAAAHDLVDMWWGSMGHRMNMLGDYKLLGIGVYLSSDGALYGTQIFGDR